MRIRTLVLVSLALAAAVAFVAVSRAEPAKVEWSINATAIEACSCPMFCQCYFNTKPAAHHEHGAAGEKHFCRANLAYKMNKGHYGKVSLDGAKFWVVSDLGGDFTQPMEWAVLYFDKSMTKEQRDAIAAIWPSVFPVKWKSFKTAEAVIDTWEFNKDAAVAKMDGGKTAEVRLKRYPGNTNEPVVIHNLKYWGAPRNDGFVLMPNEVEAYRVSDKAFEYKGTNGFMITIDMNSNDVS